MKENGFYVILAVVSLIGILALGLLIYKASQIPGFYPSKEPIATSAAYPQATESPQTTE